MQEMNVKSTYLPHYCSVKSSLSAGVWGSGMQLTSALHTLHTVLRLLLQRTFVFHNFPRVPLGLHAKCLDVLNTRYDLIA